MSHKKNIEMIKIVASGLQELNEEIVYVGGATVGFYIDNNEVNEIRPTEDVDCIIEIASRSDYNKLETKLRSIGFQNKIDSGESIICRWIYSGITVDIMPTDDSILGFTNRWYSDGIASSHVVNISNEINIRIFTLPYFLASKIEAYKSRGGGDYRMSSDIEDLVSVVADNENVKISILNAELRVRNYLFEEFTNFMKDGNFIEGIYAHMTTAEDAENALESFKSILS